MQRMQENEWKEWVFEFEIALPFREVLDPQHFLDWILHDYCILFPYAADNHLD